MTATEQLKKALAAVSALEKAGVRVVQVVQNESGVPFILVDGEDAQTLILTNKIEMKPRTYTKNTPPHGSVCETYQCEYMDCVVWFSFLSGPENTQKGNDATKRLLN